MTRAYGDPFPQEKLLIGLIGSHCTGKTSVGTLLSQWTGFPFLVEGIREVVNLMGYQQIHEVPDKTLMQWNILRYQINQEQSARKLQEVQGANSVAYITDRTTLDNAAYFHLYNYRKVPSSEYLAYMNRALLHAAKEYTHLLYFPILWDEIENDGFRDTDPGPRQDIDRLILNYVVNEELSSKLYVVTAGSVQERCAAIMEHLQLWPRMREMAPTLDLYKEKTSP